MGYVFHFEEVFRYWPLLVQGIAVTLAYTFIAMVASVVVGLAMALARRSRFSAVRGFAWCYVETIRNTPFLVQLFILYFGLPTFGIRLTPHTAAGLGLVIYNGAFATEIMRAGIQAVHRSQIEAGLSIGMSRVQVFFYIVLRPALEKVYPALSSQLILLMLATSVVSGIGADELLSHARFIETTNFRAIEVYLVCIVIYLGLTLLLRFAARAFGGWLFHRPRQRSSPAYAG